MHTAKLGAYGNTALPASQLRSAVRELLNGQAHTQQVDVFFTDAPHSGGTMQPLSVTFDKIEGDILFGELEGGEPIAFFLRDPNGTATFIIGKVE